MVFNYKKHESHSTYSSTKVPKTKRTEMHFVIISIIIGWLYCNHKSARYHWHTYVQSCIQLTYYTLFYNSLQIKLSKRKILITGINSYYNYFDLFGCFFGIQPNNIKTCLTYNYCILSLDLLIHLQTFGFTLLKVNSKVLLSTTTFKNLIYWHL